MDGTLFLIQIRQPILLRLRSHFPVPHRQSGCLFFPAISSGLP